MNKSLPIFLVLTALTFFASPVQSEPYLTEEQKELLLKDSRELELSKGKALAQNTSGQRDQNKVIKQQNDPVKPHQTGPIYLGVTSTYNARTQSLQSIFNNANWGTPTYSNHSVQQSRKVAPTTNSNRSVQQDQRLANTAKRRNSDRQSQQVATITTKTTTNYTNNSNRSVQQSRKVAKTKKKFNWSVFFKGLGQVAEAINSGMNQANSQYKRSNKIGQLNGNPYNPNSTSNPYGAGNPYNPNSINNPYGKYGSPYSNKSATNPYATNPPKLYDSHVKRKIVTLI